MARPSRYSPEVRERAVRMVWEHRGEYDSEWAAMESIAAKIGCTTETLSGSSLEPNRNQAPICAV